ncbi:MAG: glycerol-3-phosphate 1-O-acyltransferase PlsY [Kiritimatiellae bacterium]|nr:glycerol-3-phosphate 1-O-acyltransferase PlsY [Kiritimatiellia bacterium]
MNQETAIIVAVWMLAAYLVGGIPFGFLIGKARGVDVRTVGSKNIGATNVFRTVGKGWGLLAFACDVLKGLVPTLLARQWAMDPELPPDGSWFPLVVGVTCVIGHMLTPYMKFRGGKGVATAFGMLIGLAPALVGAAFALFALVFACTHYISLGSCAAAAFLMVAVWIPMPRLGSEGFANLPQCVLVTLIAAFVIFKHRSNIARLVRGEESRIYLFGKKKAED